MCKLCGPAFNLVDLLETHLGARFDIAPLPHDRPPIVRLKQWRAVEGVSIDEHLYLLLQHTPRPRTGCWTLTGRERDAVRLACSGATNKEIAYRMSIAVSTVGVLLWRASRKLEAASREELTDVFAPHFRSAREAQ